VMPKVMEKLKTLSDKPVRFAINTHFHGDHNSGNEILSSTATIIGHAKLYQRLASKTPALSPRSLPTITFSDSIIMHFNNEEIRLIHLPDGHTDNDVVVYFVESKVVHMGDMFFFGMFPQNRCAKRPQRFDIGCHRSATHAGLCHDELREHDKRRNDRAELRRRS